MLSPRAQHLRNLLQMGPHDRILVAWVELVSGPGWTNHLVHIVIADPQSTLRRVSFQPDEWYRIEGIPTLAPVLESAMGEFLKHLTRALNEPAKGEKFMKMVEKVRELPTTLLASAISPKKRVKK